MQILGILETSLKKWGANLILINVGLEGCGITILTRVFEANPLISCTSFIDNDLYAYGSEVASLVSC